MHLFKDKKGREWKVELNVGIMECVQSKLELNLFDPVSEDKSLIVDLAPIRIENVRTFANMLYLLCQDQCEASDPKIAPLNFGFLLQGDVLRLAYEAFYSEWQDFFQGLGRTDLAEVIGKMNSLMQEGIDKTAEGVRSLTFEKVKEEIDKATMNSVTN